MKAAGAPRLWHAPDQPGRLCKTCTASQLGYGLAHTIGLDHIVMSRRVPRITLILLLAGLLGGLAAVRPAYSRVFIGFGFPLFVGPPLYVPPPLYYPPPAYYPPPPYYPPPAYAAGPQGGYPSPQAGYASPQAGQSCNAGGFICPTDRPLSAGSACYCRDRNGQRVWGHAG